MKINPALKQAISLALSAGFAIALTGCASPGSRTDVAAQPVEHYASQQAFANATGAWPIDAWWQAYGDSQLNTLIDEALANSPSIAIAQARLQHAQSYAQVAGAATLPQLSANTSTTEQKQSYNYLSPPAFTPQGWHDYGRASLDFSWELDFFGKNHAALAAATSEAQAVRADAAQARLMLSANIAAAYAELARQYAALDTSQAALEVRRATADLFRQRYNNGLETLGSVRQVEARRAAAESDALSISEQINLQCNRIAALLGAGPDRALSITRPALKLSRQMELPQQLATQLLERRPDLFAAKLRADAAHERIDQARAAFYPSVNLTAFIGLQSLNLDMLTKNGSSVGSIGPAVSLPIFTGGRLRGQLHGAEADYAEAVANYGKAVVQALQEVADAVVSERALVGELSKTNEAVDAAREAWRIQNNRYDGGLATYLDVLSAEDYLLSNLRTQTDLQSRALTLDVSLIRALGGGYSALN